MKVGEFQGRGACATGFWGWEVAHGGSVDLKQIILRHRVGESPELEVPTGC